MESVQTDVIQLRASNGRPPRYFWYDETSSSILREIGSFPFESFHEDEPFDFMSSSRVRAALSMAGLILAACREPGIETLAAELGERRLLEARLTGGFAHAPCRTDWNASDLIPDPRCSELPPGSSVERIAARIRRQAGKQATVPALHAQGVAELVLSREGRDVETAVATLEQAVAAAPRDGRLLSDLAAAYLVRAQREDDPVDLVRGLSSADRALRADGLLPEARFNRALALELLFLQPEARKAWDRYLDVDRESAWADEAKARLAVLQEAVPRRAWAEQQLLLERSALAGDREAVGRIVRRYPQEAREWAEQTLLGDWADAAGRGEPDRAARALRIARLIGDALAAMGGERLLQGTVATLDAASRTADARRLQTLLEGHLAFREGYALYKSREPGRSMPRLESARQKLALAGSPFAARAAFFLACNDNLQGRYSRSLAAMERLDRELAGKPYPGLLAHIAWMEALNRISDGQAMGAIEAYDRSLALYRRAGENGNVASVEALLAETYWLVGHRREAWSHAYRALRSVQELRDPSQRSLVFTVTADIALWEGELETALLFQDEVVREAADSNPTRQAEARIWRGMLAERLGRRDLALADLREAGRQIRRVHDPVLHARKQVDLAMAEGTVVLEREPRRAIPLLTSALEVYEREQNHVFALRVHQLRARAYRLAGDDRLAEADLKAGLAEYERLGGSLNKEDLRLAFLAETEGVFDEMISFQVDRRPDLAFAYADRARTRVLPGSASRLWAEASDRRLLTAEPHPLELTEIRRRLPEKTSLVQYSVLPDRVLVWRLRRQGAQLFVQRIPRAELDARVRRMQFFQPAGAASWREASMGLFDLLVRPWLSQVEEGERLVFVPDKVLHSLPFACLMDRGSRRYLIQDLEIVVAPSATLYVNALDRERRWAGVPFASRRALVVGDPAFERGRFPGLVRLPHAGREVARVAALHGISPLTGEAADRRTFLAQAPGAEWIHFAGHSVIDLRNPLLSVLALARGAGDATGAISAREIYPLDLHATRLVILAACDTGAGYRPGSEGISGFARAFFAAGVPTVVASLWKVDDETTGKLLYAFHENLLAHHDPARALREAQLALLASRDGEESSPTAWGAFEVIGASAHDAPRKGA